jgi:hypothetical protein
LGRGNRSAEVEATLSFGLPREERLAVGESEGEHGESSMMLLRFAGGSADGGAGESTKNEPSPGEPSMDPAREVQGDCGIDAAREPKAGESISIASHAAVLNLGEATGSVCLISNCTRGFGK